MNEKIVNEIVRKLIVHNSPKRYTGIKNNAGELKHWKRIQSLRERGNYGDFIELHTQTNQQHIV